jgi:serine/threonine protein phosphatase 1
MDMTEGRRIYTIGDVHGCIDHLLRVEAGIMADLRARPHPDPLVVLVGDFTDRGPDSRAVIEHLVTMQRGGPETICLLGNHDYCFLEYWTDPLTQSASLHWLNRRMGGDMTLASYGVAGASEHQPERSHAAFRAAVPDRHLEFLQTLKTYHAVGDYLFVHAGIRPGIALPEQELMDLIWIRDGFLDFTGDLGTMVVHGHTVVPQVERHANRLAIDTGAVFGGPLSCVVLEGDDIGQLVGEQVIPLHLTRFRRA